MNSRWCQQLGFTLLELLIGLVIAVTLAIISIPLVYHYCNAISSVSKIENSIETLKDASTLYYYNDMKSVQKPAIVLPLTIQRLYDLHLLNSNDLFNSISKDNKGHISSTLYNYAVSYDEVTHLIDINLITTRPVNFQTENPNHFSKTTEPKTGVTTYSYDWQFFPLLDIYSHQQNARIVRFQRMVDGNDQSV